MFLRELSPRCARARAFLGWVGAGGALVAGGVGVDSCLFWCAGALGSFPACCVFFPGLSVVRAGTCIGSRRFGLEVSRRERPRTLWRCLLVWRRCVLPFVPQGWVSGGLLPRSRLFFELVYY